MTDSVANSLITAVWTIVLLAALYHGVELQDQFHNVADSAPQQAAIAAYRAGMTVFVYVLGRGITEIFDMNRKQSHGTR